MACSSRPPVVPGGFTATASVPAQPPRGTTWLSWECPLGPGTLQALTPPASGLGVGFPTTPEPTLSVPSTQTHSSQWPPPCPCCIRVPAQASSSFRPRWRPVPICVACLPWPRTPLPPPTARAPSDSVGQAFRITATLVPRRGLGLWSPIQGGSPQALKVGGGAGGNGSLGSPSWPGWPRGLQEPWL